MILMLDRHSYLAKKNVKIEAFDGVAQAINHKLFFMNEWICI